MSLSIVVAYPVTAEQLATQVSAFRGQSFATPALYKEGTKSIATCRELRVEIETRRKMLKHDSLEYGRKVDAVAKELTDIIEAVERELKASRKLIDDEKERLKREAQEAERQRVAAEMAAKREAEEAVLRAQRQAEEEQLAASRRALEAERLAFAKERQEAEALANEQRRLLGAEREKHAAELAELRAKREAAESERRGQELAERLRIEEEERRINALEAERQRQKRLAALAPDQDKLNQVARALQALIDDNGEWEMESQSAVDTMDGALADMAAIVETLTTWKARQQ